MSEVKTLQLLSRLNLNTFSTIALTVILLSMAGVPPFIGFFSKLFLILILLNNAFFLFFSLFAVVLILGLYFYIQNIRFLHSSKLSLVNYTYLNNERQIIIYFYLTVCLMLLLSVGFIFIDDLLLFLT